MRSQWPEAHEEQGYTVLKRVYIAGMSVQLNCRNPINALFASCKPE